MKVSFALGIGVEAVQNHENDTENVLFANLD